MEPKANVPSLFRSTTVNAFAASFSYIHMYIQFMCPLPPLHPLLLLLLQCSSNNTHDELLNYDPSRRHPCTTINQVTLCTVLATYGGLAGWLAGRAECVSLVSVSVLFVTHNERQTMHNTAATTPTTPAPANAIYLYNSQRYEIRVQTQERLRPLLLLLHLVTINPVNDYCVFTPSQNDYNIV